MKNLDAFADASGQICVNLGEAPCSHTTTMSNIPTPKEIPPTPQQVDRTLQSVISAAQSLISSDPRHFANLRASFLALYTHPTFQLILGIPSQTPANDPQPNKQLQTDLTALKSSITALTKSVADLQPKVKEVKAPNTKPPPPKGNPNAQGKGHAHTNTPTYASTAAAKTRPSLILDLGATNPDKQLNSELTADLNGMLLATGHADIKISATRYTKKGNLVLTAHHTTSQSQLNEAAIEIKQHVKQCYVKANIIITPPNNYITPRANVKWSKILINSIPIGKRPDRSPWTPEECHRALIAHNPSYAALKVTQKPSWVRPPPTLKENTRSSLVVAFEDPDGSVRRTLLSNKQLYLLGARAKVSRWKEKPRQPHTTYTPDAQSENDLVEELLNLPPIDLTARANTPDVFSTSQPSTLPVTQSMLARAKKQAASTD
jgi:hypothetical protein